MGKLESLPWMPWFPRDFRSSTIGWPLIAKAIYRELLDAQWDMERLPIDPDKLRRIETWLWREGEGDGALGAAGLADFAELTALGRREAEALLAIDPLLADPAHAALAAAARARTAMLFAGEAG